MEEKIEKLENLPIKEGRKAYLTNKYGDMWDLHKFDHRWHRSDKSDYAWVKAERAIKRFLGKSYDKAFSYYCEQVEQYDYHEFKKYFESDNLRYYNTQYPTEYIVDGNGNIQYNKEYKLKPWRKRKEETKGVIFKSYDYKEGYTHVKTGETKSDLRWFDNNSHWIYSVIDGFSKEFKSEFEKEYIRLVKEDKQRKELAYRRYEKWRKKHKVYDFRTDEEKNRIKEEESDLIKRDAHGFDDKSFIGEEYHGQKRKKNKIKK
jgi:hypothetical protein